MIKLMTLVKSPTDIALDDFRDFWRSAFFPAMHAIPAVRSHLVKAVHHHALPMEIRHEEGIENARWAGVGTYYFDSRAGVGRVASRIGLHADATPFSAADDLYALIEDMHRNEQVACVFIDEAQFLVPEQVWQLARLADRLGIPVMAYGLRTDFQGKLFPGSQELLAIADELREVRTICFCGRKATMVARLDENGSFVREGAQVDVGGNEKYVSFCRRHWEEKIRCFGVA